MSNSRIDVMIHATTAVSLEFILRYDDDRVYEFTNYIFIRVLIWYYNESYQEKNL